MPTSTEFFGYQFTNLGPLTTTYEPPASCTTATTDHIYFANVSDFNRGYGVATCGAEKMSDCYPSGSAFDKVNSHNHKSGGMGTLDYFSPGVVCPKGWTTAGTFAQDDKKTKAGIFTTDDATPDYQLPPEDVWRGILEPGETVAYCCPSGWHGGVWKGCFSSIEPFKSGSYSEYCSQGMPLSAIDEAYTVGTSVLSDPVISFRTYDVSASTRPIITAQGPWPTDMDEVVIIRNLPAVALIHKQEDVQDTDGIESGSSDGADDADDNAASAMNGATLAPAVAVCVGILVGAGMLFN
ncbi:hypothetical protein FLONG3_6440 [Fusarium longipes]|uniref:Uncharacterized protein n=1 Tax=Fusarium longipes TaxID=694270 RepID=A0A395SL27_9HYPO|nr:hypothetical protein FLONG3_6440 [Fusarium longipes]